MDERRVLQDIVRLISGIYMFLGVTGLITGVTFAFVFRAGTLFGGNSLIQEFLSRFVGFAPTSSIQGFYLSITTILVSFGFIYSGMQLFSIRLVGVLSSYDVSAFALAVYAGAKGFDIAAVSLIMASNILLTTVVWYLRRDRIL